MNQFLFLPLLTLVFVNSVSPDQTVAQLLHVCSVTGVFSGQNAPMDGGMKGLYSAA